MGKQILKRHFKANYKRWYNGQRGGHLDMAAGGLVWGHVEGPRASLGKELLSGLCFFMTQRSRTYVSLPCPCPGPFP